MHPFAYPLANSLALAKAGHVTAEQIADLFQHWPAQRKKELYDIIEETWNQEMVFKVSVMVLDEALCINELDWKGVVIH
jgi:hypothetical protein